MNKQKKQLRKFKMENNTKIQSKGIFESQNALHSKKSVRDAFGKALVELGKQNKNIVAFSADLAGSVRTNWFAKEFPDRHFEVGISEQNMMGVASGLAACGKIPFVGSFAVFNPGRNLDQLRASVCYSNMNVKIIGAHAGITVGEDGATHQALEDIAITRSLPNLTVIVPSDYNEMYKATIASAKHKGPVYIRSGRPKVEQLPESDFVIGKANILQKGSDITIIACGIMVQESLKAANELKKQGISARVINMHTIKPIDKEIIINAAKETKGIITVEEHQIHGGLGSAVAEVVVENHPIPMKIIGVKDTFGESGSGPELLEKYGLTSKQIIKEAINLLS
jgi:transketolase